MLKKFLNNYLSSLKEQLDENSQIIIFDNGNVHLDVKVSPKEETVWLYVKQIAPLFGTTSRNIFLHIKNIIEEGELEWFSTEKDFFTVQKLLN